MDLFGDRLCTETGLVGDHHRRRHDAIKLELNNVCIWAGLQAECEPYGMFNDLIPQQPNNRIERRARQVLRPDFKFQLNSTVNGIPESRVADIKTVSCGAPSWYKAGARAVDRRAAVVPGEYARTAKDMDEELGVDVANIQGPVSRRLQEVSPVIPLIFGGFAEVSEGVHNLMDKLSRQRLSKEGLAVGRQGSGRRLGEIMGQLRRRLSLATVKANTDCLLARLSLVGDGATQAGKRRSWQRREEHQMKQDREGFWRALVSGRSVVQKGKFWLD